MTHTPDYVDPGHAGVWPDKESPAVRNIYDQMVAEQGNGCSYPVERTR